MYGYNSHFVLMIPANNQLMSFTTERSLGNMTREIIIHPAHLSGINWKEPAIVNGHDPAK